MGQQICYLYEYKESVPVRNVGFIRSEQKREGAVFSISAKGIMEHANGKLEIFGFCMKHGSCETVSLGEVPIVHGSVSQMLETEERLDGLDGILIKCEEKVLYAAVWQPVKVNFTGCVRRESQKEEIAEKSSEEKDAEAEESFAEESVLEQEIDPEQCACAGGQTDDEECGGKERLQCRKIRRNDLGELARGEWKLANNSFLLHGYYNYHHLLLIEEGDDCILGVPGIYHRRERQAAECFGFLEFREAEGLPVTLSEQERNDYERFGYWCRKVEKGQ